MFNATEYRLRAKHETRLDSYFKTQGFNAILTGLVADQVPEADIMRVTRGAQGCTMLNDMFFLDFMAWIGGPVYYRALKRFSCYPTPTPTSEHHP